ncbi:MAG: glutamine-hydrolyzing GMP synthase, partial [Alphaproteobacteria bacterium]|nr:glutamine-hydrolyzing GMP synthase [Alphaproteobacteria bacterium]
MTDSILILDFGSQVTQLIARRVRESGVYCEIVPYFKGQEALREIRPKGVILSGGPSSATESDTPRAPQGLFDLGLPVLGICYGHMAMCAQLGGRVEASEQQEFGRAFVDINDDCALFQGLWQPGRKYQVWMSHGDQVMEIPPGFRVVGTSDDCPFAAIADDARGFYGVQFHPEVMHTPDGTALLRNFTHNVAGCRGDWSMATFRHEAEARVKAQVGGGKVICGLSGGVDSSVVAILLHEAIGEQLTCVFVDHGLLREGEAEEVVSLFKEHYNLSLVHRDA